MRLQVDIVRNSELRVDQRDTYRDKDVIGVVVSRKLETQLRKLTQYEIKYYALIIVIDIGTQNGKVSI